MIQVPVAKGPSQKGGGPAIIGVLFVLVAGWFAVQVPLTDGNTALANLVAAVTLLFVGLQLLTPKK